MSTYRVAQCRPQSSGSGSWGLSKYDAVTGDITTCIQHEYRVAHKFTPMTLLPASTHIQGGPEVYISDIITCVQHVYRWPESLHQWNRYLLIHVYRVAQKSTSATLLPVFNTCTGWPKSLHQWHYYLHSTHILGGPKVYISDIITRIQHVYRVAQKFTPAILLPSLNTHIGWPRSLHQRHYHLHSTRVQDAHKFIPVTLLPVFNTCTGWPRSLQR